MMHNFLIDLSRAIQSQIGIACQANPISGDGYSDFVIRSSEPDYQKPHGWYLRVEILENTFRFDFSFDESAGLLCKFYFEKLLDMPTNQVFKSDLESFTNNYFSVHIYFDDRLISLDDSDIDRSPLNIKIRAKGRIDAEDLNVAATNSILDFLFLVISPLLPDDGEKNVSEYLFESGLPEGAAKTVLVNKYERNPKNRLACIRHYGTKCFVCNFDFEMVYGSFASNYIHVHHLIPVSKMGENYVVNPIKDLVPLCPNCHSAIHISNPPISPEELMNRMQVNPKKD